MLTLPGLSGESLPDLAECCLLSEKGVELR